MWMDQVQELRRFALDPSVQEGPDQKLFEIYTNCNSEFRIVLIYLI